MKGLPFCESHLEYLKPDKYLDAEGKKLPPPCSGCAEISSRFRRANDQIKSATKVVQLAVAALYALHPPPPEVTLPEKLAVKGLDMGDSK